MATLKQISLSWRMGRVALWARYDMNMPGTRLLPGVEVRSRAVSVGARRLLLGFGYAARVHVPSWLVVSSAASQHLRRTTGLWKAWENRLLPSLLYSFGQLSRFITFPGQSPRLPSLEICDCCCARISSAFHPQKLHAAAFHVHPDLVTVAGSLASYLPHSVAPAPPTPFARPTILFPPPSLAPAVDAFGRHRPVGPTAAQGPTSRRAALPDVRRCCHPIQS